MLRKVEHWGFATHLKLYNSVDEKYFYERDEKKWPFNYETQFIHESAAPNVRTLLHCDVLKNHFNLKPNFGPAPPPRPIFFFFILGLGGPVQNTNNKRQHCKVVHTCTLGGEEGDAKKNERQSRRQIRASAYRVTCVVSLSPQHITEEGLE